MRTRPLVRGLLGLGALAAVAGLAFVTKPGGRAGLTSSVVPAANVAVPVAAPVERTPPSPAVPPTAGERGHGDNAVVRSREALDSPSAAPLPLSAPKWSEPVELTFSSFKSLRRRYRENKAFAPEEVARLHGAAVVVRGALMPIDPIPKSGEMRRFWLANPVVVMAGCVFCNPPTMADLMYVTTGDAPLVVNRERLYRSVEYAKLIGRFALGPGASEDGVEYMFSMEMKERLE